MLARVKLHLTDKRTQQTCLRQIRQWQDTTHRMTTDSLKTVITQKRMHNY